MKIQLLALIAMLAGGTASAQFEPPAEEPPMESWWEAGPMFPDEPGDFAPGDFEDRMIEPSGFAPPPEGGPREGRMRGDRGGPGPRVQADPEGRREGRREFAGPPGRGPMRGPMGGPSAGRRGPIPDRGPGEWRERGPRERGMQGTTPWRGEGRGVGPRAEGGLDRPWRDEWQGQGRREMRAPRPEDSRRGPMRDRVQGGDEPSRKHDRGQRRGRPGPNAEGRMPEVDAGMPHGNPWRSEGPSGNLERGERPMRGPRAERGEGFERGMGPRPEGERRGRSGEGEEGGRPHREAPPAPMDPNDPSMD